jgi:signal transduction histidine kinase
MISELKTKGFVKDLELKGVKKDGKHITISLSISKMMLNNQMYIIGITRDITERKIAEEALKNYSARLEAEVSARTQELRQAQEQVVRQERLAVLGQLAGSVGHELRNPLGVINTSIYYLKLVQPDADWKIKEHHTIIEKEVQNATKIIGDLLDYARVISSDRQTASVPALVRQTLDRFPVPAGVKLTLDLPDDLPDVFADPLQVQQVLGNLTVNACQAMAASVGRLSPQTGSVTAMAGGGELTISAHEVVPVAGRRREKKMVAIFVKDTGTGITPENMKRLFEPLFSTRITGIGLGLAVSRKLVEANDGSIEVESEVGKGSTFKLFLPAADRQ